MSAPLHHPSVRASLTFAVLEAAVVGGMFACLEAWIVPLLQGRLGVSAALIGLLAMLPQLAAIGFGPISGRIIRALGGPRRVAIHHCWVQVAGFGLLQIPLALAAEGHPPAWAAGFALTVVAAMNGVGAVLGGPAWMAWFGGLVPHRVMGRYTSHRNRIFHLSRLGFAGAFMLIMTTWPVTETIIGLQIVLALALVSRLVSTLLQFRQIEPQTRGAWDQHHAATSGFITFVRQLPATPFGRFTLVWSLFHVGLMVAGPYYATYLVAHQTEGGLDLSGQAILYTTLIYLNTVLRLLALPAAGRLVDRVGAAPCFRLALVLLSLIPVGWGLSAATGTVTPVLVVEALRGLAWALADAAIGPLLLRCHPDPAQRAHLIAWHGTLFNAACLIGTGLGMAILTLPHGTIDVYLVLFAASLALRLPALLMAHRYLPMPADGWQRLVRGLRGA